MSILGMVVMWVWLVVAFVIVSRWHMGGESDERQKYWEHFEGK